MKQAIVVAIVMLLFAVPAGAADEAPQPRVTMDEDLWVAFYDVPSRRFRDIRSAFMRRQFDAAAADLGTSASFLEIESQRAVPAISTRLAEVVERMRWMADNLDGSDVTAADLDAQFSRAHWLLAQHFLDMARRSRDAGQNRNAGLYLWATTHHVERAVLWSNARIDRDVQKTLEGLRDLASRLQTQDGAKAALREKPLVRAELLLTKLGKTIDRPVVLPAIAAD